MDRLERLAVFVAIMEEGSLAGAARRLRLSAPSVTRVLGELEAALGVRLITRTTRRLAATEAGRMLEARARGVLAQYDDAIEAAAGVQGQLRGTLRVTAPLVFGRLHVAPVVAGFLALYPEMRVELVLSDRNVDLVEEQIDVAVRIGALPDSTLVARRVGEVRQLVVASPVYVARRGAPEGIGELARHDIIFAAVRPRAVEWRLQVEGAMRSVALAPRFVVNDIDAAIGVARLGHGLVSVFSYQVAADLAQGALREVLSAFEPEAVPVQVVTPTARLMPQRVRRFVDYAVGVLEGLGLGVC